MKNTLKFLFSVARNNSLSTREELAAHADDYHNFNILVEIDQGAQWLAHIQMPGVQILRLAELTLTPEDYLSVLAEAWPSERHSFFDRYVRLLHDSRPDDAVNTEDVEHMREDVENTMKRINDVCDSNVNSASRAYGLVVGRVQSGKTRNYIGLAIKAYSEGWNCVIVLTSNNTALALQTRNRMIDEFRDVQCPISYLDFLNGVPQQHWVNGTCYFGIAQKEQNHLGRIKDWLDRCGELSIGQMKLLVIDDEADNATPDTQQTSATILSDADVENLARNVRREDNDPVSAWIESLTNLDCRERANEIGLNYEETQQALQNATTRNAILTLFRDVNGPVCRILNLDEEIIVNGQNYILAELVSQRFSNAARRNVGVENWKSLRDLAWYAFETRPLRSRINHLITQLFSRFDRTSAYDYAFGRFAYVGYTATPYANMLNEHPDQDPLASDFMYPMRTSRHYFGLDRIYGAPQIQGDANANMNIVRAIDEEQAIVDGVRELSEDPSLGEINVDNDFMVTISRNGEDPVTVKWNTLKNAMAWLFCAAASRRFQRLSNTDANVRTKRSYRWTTMLFNIGSETATHERQHKFVTEFLNRLGDPNMQEFRADFLELCRFQWSEQGERGLFNRQQFNLVCSDYGTDVVVSPDAWAQLEPHIHWFLDRVANDNRVHAIVVNCTPKGKEGLLQYRDDGGGYAGNDDDHIWIICGGNTIARGLTLDGLVVSYFDRARTSTCVDTLEQMGRWFGYREGYELLPRIWMTAAPTIEVKRMAKIESVMHEALREAFDAYPEFTPKDRGHYARIMRFGRDLSGRSAAEINHVASGGNFDTFGTVSTVNRRKVLDRLSRFVEDLNRLPGPLQRPAAQYRNQTPQGGFHSYPYWRNVTPQAIKGFLQDLANQTSPEGAQKILALEREIATREWDVVLSDLRPRQDADETWNVGGIDVHIGHSPVTRQDTSNYTVTFGKFVGDNFAFFSGVKTRAIVKAEVDILTEKLKDPFWAPNGVTRGTCQQAAYVANADGFLHMLPPDVRGAIGVGRMSGIDYRDRVFCKIDLQHPEFERPNPILQISLVRPSGGEINDAPFVLVSFYWPLHDDTRYVWASVGFDDERNSITSDDIQDVVNSVLYDQSFLCRHVLKALVERQLGSPDISDADFNAALKSPRSQCKNLIPVSSRMLPNTWMSERWLRQLEDHDEDRSVRVQLEVEAREMLDDYQAIIPIDRLNATFLARYPFRTGIVNHDNFEELFTDMGTNGELERIELTDCGWAARFIVDDDDDLNDDDLDDDADA